MPDIGFGGNVGSAFSSYSTWSYGISLPTGRPFNDGTTGAYLTALGAYIQGRSGSASVYLELATALTSTFALSNGGTSSHDFTGYIAVTTPKFVNGSTATFYFNRVSGTVNFGRSSTSGAVNVYDNNGSTWSGTMGGGYSYIQAPTAPGFTSVTSNLDGDQLTIITSAPSDNGGSALTGYRIQRALDSGFTSGLATVDSAGTTIMTGLTPGATYYLRDTARNYVTDTASKLGGAWSSTYTITMPDTAGAGRIYSSGSFVAAAVRRYNGSTFADAAGRRYNGSIWQDLGG